MTIEEVKAFQQAIRSAAWKLGLDAFAEKFGHDPEHDYTRDKFKDFQAQFDAESLTKIIT